MKKQRDAYAAVRSAFDQLRSEHPDERFYYLGLETRSGGFVPVGCSRESLDAKVARYLRVYPDRSEDSIRGDIRERGSEFLPSDYAGPPVRHVGYSADGLVAAIQRLDDEGYFGIRERRDTLIGLLVGQSCRQWYEFATQLNPPSLLQALDDRLPYRPASPNADMFGPACVFSRISSGGGRLAAFYKHGVVILNAATRQLVHEIQADDVRSGQISGDGQTVVFGGSGAVRVVDVSTGVSRVLGLPPSGDLRYHIVNTRISPSGDVAALGGESSVALMDIRSSKASLVNIGGISLSWSPNGRMLAAGDRSGTLSLVDTREGEILGQQHLGGPVMGIAWSPTGDCLFAVVPSSQPWLRDGMIHVLASGTLDSIRRIPGAWGGGGVAVSPNGECLVACTKREMVILDQKGNESSRVRGLLSSLYDCCFVGSSYVVGVGFEDEPAVGIVGYRLPGNDPAVQDRAPRGLHAGPPHPCLRRGPEHGRCTQLLRRPRVCWSIDFFLAKMSRSSTPVARANSLATAAYALGVYAPRRVPRTEGSVVVHRVFPGRLRQIMRAFAPPICANRVPPRVARCS